MLECTFHRAERLIPRERLFAVVSQSHLRYHEAWEQLSDRPKGTVVLQPENKDTAPGLLLPLMHLYKRYPDSVVTIFPSDHFIMEEDLFMDYVDLACSEVEKDSSRLVLLGMEPDGPEPEYGYILPGEGFDHQGLLTASKILGFFEKPKLEVARELIQRGGLWNILVMVFKTRTFLEWVSRVAPLLYRSFFEISEAIGTDRQEEVVRQVYQQLEPVNLSKDLLEIFAVDPSSNLYVLPVRNVFWSDWGSERRILNTLQRVIRKERSVVQSGNVCETRETSWIFNNERGGSHGLSQPGFSKPV